MRKGEISEFKKISPFLYYWQYCFLVEVIKMEKKSNTVKKKKTKRLDAKENFWGYVFLSPVIIGFLVFTVFPVVMSFYYSLTNSVNSTTEICRISKLRDAFYKQRIR